ncbi:hypothetical protein RQN30_06910 [Arcanobacterium hippocoleae]
MSVSDARDAMRTMVGLGLVNIEEHLTERLDGMSALLERMESYALPVEGPVAETIADLRTMHALWMRLVDRYSESDHQDYVTYFECINERLGILGFDTRDALFLDQVSATGSEDGLTKHQLDDLDTLLVLAPAFDVNTLIQQELIYRLGGYDQLEQQDLADGAFFRLLTEVNLAYAHYWSDPFEHFASQCPNVDALQRVKQEFIEIIRGRFTAGVTSEVEILSEDVNRLQGMLPDGVTAHGYVYSVFGQHCPDGKLVVNNFYPGHMSFMHRYTRHLDLGDEINNRLRAFYHRAGQVPIEIYETMGFNANIHRPCYEERLLFDASRDRSDGGRFIRQIPLGQCRLVPRGSGIGLKGYDGLTRVPILPSSLIRVLYPGQVAFFASLFDNISFINNLAGLFLSEEGNKDIVLSPECVSNL